ncbi:MAG: ATP-dependent DNA helicase [Haloferacaceae archaeon]
MSRDGSGAGAAVRRFFPYEKPYPNQRAAMDGVATALADGRDVLFEGAPGTGKTLSALVPALEHAREHDRTVVITTDVHQQMRQFVADARAIRDEHPISAVVFRGKGSMCHIDVDYRECQTLRDATRSLVEVESERADLARRAEALLDEMRAGHEGAGEARAAVLDELDALEAEAAELREGNVCDRYRANLARDTGGFREWLFDGVRTPDEVYEWAEEHGFCGYELLKEEMEAVDLVVCNYHHLLDPTIREQFFRWLGREPDEVVTVFDEAHNVAGAAREHASRTLSERTVEAALAECEEADDPQAGAAANAFGALLAGLRETYENAFGFGEREQVGDSWYDLSIATDEGRDELTRAMVRAYEGPGIAQDVERAREFGAALDEAYEQAFAEGETATRRECHALPAAEFLAAWLDAGEDPGRHPMLSVRRDAGTGDLYGRAELYTCIPREVTADLFGRVHASVLMSATLRPFDVLADVLGLEDPATMAYGLPYPEERRRTYAVAGPALFASERDDPSVQETVATTLADAVRVTPGNVLAFFPSYGEAERYHDLLFGDDGGRGGVDATAYLDEPGTRAEGLRERFVADGNGVLFTSVWGTLAEGVSFDGDDARAVVVVGVPYPHLNERVEAVEAAYDRAYADGERSGWDYAVGIPTVRKTRQALGRVVRSPEDFGVRILLDRRYTRESRDMGRYGVRDAFPPEERDELLDVDPEKLKFALLNFFGDRDAYDGDPPAP